MTVKAINGLSFDLEDWEQNVKLATLHKKASPSGKLHAQVDNILALCESTGTKATFFVVARLAREVPNLIRRIVMAGHEIACHSNEHRLVFDLTRDQFAADTRIAKSTLEEIAGTRVRGYRAPEFSVTSLTHSCFSVLAELGFDYDSSVFPVDGTRYGIPTAPTTPFLMSTPSGSLVELPLLSLRVAGVNVPAAGGTYYRLLPRLILMRAVASAQRRGAPAILYFHPYEFTNDKLWLHGEGLGNVAALRYIFLHNMATRHITMRLRSVLERFEFGRLCDVTEEIKRGFNGNG